MSRTPDRSKQSRTGNRGPHGNPDYPARIGAWVTEAHYQLFHARGGSQWLRELLEKELKK